jgi:hypothetical protein
MKNLIQCIIVICAILLSACSTKLHWYYKRDKKSVINLADYLYLTFDNCKLTVKDKTLYSLKNQTVTGAGFYYSKSNPEYSLFDFRSRVFANSNDRAILVKYLATFTATDLPAVQNLLGEKGNSYTSGKIENKALTNLNHESVIGVYPSLSIKEMAEDGSTRSILDLKEAAQKDYLTAILANPSTYTSSTSAEKIFMNVNVRDHTDVFNSKKPETKPELKKVRITISTHNISTEPADRIVRATYKIYSKDMTFKSAMDTQMDWKTMDLGSQETTTANSFKINGGFNPLDTLAGVAAGYGRSRSSLEKFDFSKRYVVFSGAINKHDIAIYQEGVPGIDLSGSTTFNTNIAFTEGVTERIVLLFCTYTIRHVTKGAHTYIEGDDHVQYITVTLVKPYLYSRFN